ncbi:MULTISPECIES: hypothetical protein [Lactobacillus]|uniref:DNA-directed RNA polymerase beta subunit n=1 Tax=Lactobacillus xujianguonis TaxID=2495899 RepID=A0A437SU14_9LACO|nr:MULTISPECIES: hypothetical protein [Lactobacillus]RVU70396.1 hypothetical protein EJK17_07730 [Lactobacillus xujianguonis]RVU73643.1 hypothetical protein EJK20_07055 [Lactobacillus xujianguonis]
MSDKFDQKVEEFFKNYQDRGMKKWAGFFLSDHTLKINQDKAKRATVYPKKKEMSETEVSELLLKAFSDHYPVSIQLKNLDEDGSFAEDIKGFVEGYTDKNIVVVSEASVNLDEINHVEVIRLRNFE